jgi:hypothetical protein
MRIVELDRGLVGEAGDAAELRDVAPDEILQRRRGK